MKKTTISKSAGQTKKLGEDLAKKILRTAPLQKAVVLRLKGDLGSGKTTFLQGFAKGLGIKEKILSPTFVIMKKFKVLGFRFQGFYHIDCYRIQKPKEILDLGFKEIISNPQNIIAIEWVDKIKKILPRRTIFISFKFINKNKREIRNKNYIFLN